MSAVVLALAVVAEAVICVWARFAQYRGRHACFAEALVVTHWRLGRWAFMALAALAVAGASRSIGRITQAEMTRLVLDAVSRGYGRVHGYLARHLAFTLARAKRPIFHRRSCRLMTTHPPKEADVARAWPPESVPAGPEGKSAVTGDSFPSMDSMRVVAVTAWHDRITHIGLGLVAGSVLAVTIVVTGAERLPGAMAVNLGHGLGPARSLIVICVLMGLFLATLATLNGHGLRQRESAGDGFATRREARKRLSVRAVRKSAAIARPQVNVKALGARACGSYLGQYRGLPIYAHLSDTQLLIAPSQTGKTAHMIGRIIEAPGAVVATSTKPDIHEFSAELRQDEGPVWVFNPENQDRIPSNFAWSPIEGCCDSQVAGQRAGYLLAGSPTGGPDGKFWDGMAHTVLGALLHGAALGDRSMEDVLSWIADPSATEPLKIMKDDLRADRRRVRALSQIRYNMAEKTSQSVYATLARATDFMSSAAITAAICPEPGTPTFDLGKFLSGASTLYLIGSDDPHSPIAPLFTMIAGYVFTGAKALAARSPRGRLANPLSLILDEAAIICPVPLPKMMADSGGRSISIMASVQSRSQLAARWGKDDAEVIWNNANATMFFSGQRNSADLEEVSKACGEKVRHTRTVTTSPGGGRSSSVTEQMVPVLSPGQVRKIKTGRAIVIYRNMAPMIVKPERYWKRKDVKAMLKAREQAERLARGVEAIAPVGTAPVATPQASAAPTPAEVLTAPNIVAFPGYDPDEPAEVKAGGLGEDDEVTMAEARTKGDAS